MPRQKSFRDLKVCAHRHQINDRDGNGWTPLHYAAAGGKTCVMALQMLLEYKADFDLKNKKGETPLHVSCAGRHIESACELIKAGCNYEAKNNDGREPFELLDPATRGVWERDRWIRAAIDQGRDVREAIGQRVKKEAERAAEAAKLREAEKRAAAAAEAAAADVDAAVAGRQGKGGSSSANIAGKRQKYMELRDKVAVKMKQKKAESRRAVSDISSQLQQVLLLCIVLSCVHMLCYMLCCHWCSERPCSARSRHTSCRQSSDQPGHAKAPQGTGRHAVGLVHVGV